MRTHPVTHLEVKTITTILTLGGGVVGGIRSGAFPPARAALSRGDAPDAAISRPRMGTYRVAPSEIRNSAGGVSFRPREWRCEYRPYPPRESGHAPKAPELRPSYSRSQTRYPQPYNYSPWAHAAGLRGRSANQIGRFSHLNSADWPYEELQTRNGRAYISVFLLPLPFLAYSFCY